MASQKEVGTKILELMESEGLNPLDAISLTASLFVSMVQSINMPEEEAVNMMTQYIEHIYAMMDTEQQVKH